MKFKIKDMYTEKLDISSFPNSNDNKEKIELLINFNNGLFPTDDEKVVLFKINYSVTAKNSYNFLNWLAVCVLEFEEKPHKIDSEKLLNNDKIKDFIDTSINNLSFFFNGKLPNLSHILGDEK